MVISGMKTENSNYGRCKNTCNKINIDHLPRSTGFFKKKILQFCSKKLQSSTHCQEDRKIPIFLCRGTSAKLFYGHNSCPGESALQCSHKYYHPGPSALMPILSLSSLMPVYWEGPILGHSGWSGDNRQP
uniref:Uncharacterized protein n=1 Tax=Micrurus spixii TaxID=129469 RepID=A0A2D4LIF9_9SAUR